MHDSTGKKLFTQNDVNINTKTQNISFDEKIFAYIVQQIKNQQSAYTNYYALPNLLIMKFRDMA